MVKANDEEHDNNVIDIDINVYIIQLNIKSTTEIDRHNPSISKYFQRAYIICSQSKIKLNKKYIFLHIATKKSYIKKSIARLSFFLFFFVSCHTLLTLIPSQRDTALNGRRARSVRIERKAGISAAPAHMAPKFIMDN